MIERVNRWIGGRYGSRRGLLSTLQHRMWLFAGRYQGYRRINWNNVDRLVFVCKGNICRSPFAEAVARAKGLNSISCGTDVGRVVPADKNAVVAGLRNGVDLRKHMSRDIATLVFNKGDLLVVMEPGQAELIKARYGGLVACTLLGLWQKPPISYLHDPYGKSPEYYDRCFSLIEASVEGIARKIKSRKIYRE